MIPYVVDVALRDFDPRRDLRLLDRWLRSPHVVRWWGPQESYLRSLVLRSAGTHALITMGKRPVGYLCWQRLSREEIEAAALTDLPEDLVDIDIMIGEPESLGRGIGPSALALLLARLRREGVGYAGLGISKSNRAAIRASEKAGFVVFRDFEEPEFGACRYMVPRLG